MNTNVRDMIRFSFCPHFYEQQGPVDLLENSDCLSLFRTFLTYVYGRELETSSKVNWRQCLDRWTKLYWNKFEKSEVDTIRFNVSLISIKRFHDWYLKQPGSMLAVNFNYISDLYDHRYTGEIPAVLNQNDSALSLVFAEPLYTMNESSWNAFIRYASLAVEQKVKISSVINLSYFNFAEPLQIFSFKPTSRFFESAILDATNILQSMQDGASYTNTLACRTCPLKSTCEAIGGGRSGYYLSHEGS